MVVQFTLHTLEIFWANCKGSTWILNLMIVIPSELEEQQIFTSSVVIYQKLNKSGGGGVSILKTLNNCYVQWSGKQGI